MKRRVLSLLLAVLMLMSSVSVALPVSAAYENTYVNTGNHRTDIIGVAKTQIGYKEGSNNDTKYGTWYGLPNQEWCAMFVSWCARQANIPTSVLKNSSAAGHSSAYFNIPYYDGNSYTPSSGDLFFTKTWSHVGLVYYLDGSYFYTIEGNYKDQVYVERRKISDYYFGVPNYNSGSGGGSTVCTSHTKGSFLFHEEAHPHYNYYECSNCGAAFTDGSVVSVSSCTSCNSPTAPTKPIVTANKLICKVGETVTFNWQNDGTATSFWAYVRTEEQGLYSGNLHQATSFNYTFNKAGRHYIVITAINANGQTDANAVEVIVGDPSKPNVTVNKTVCKLGETATFNWENDGTATSFWAYVRTEEQGLYSDNLHQATSFDYTFNKAGRHYIVITAINANGQTDANVVTVDVNCASEHTYDDACDATCNECGAIRIPSAHQYTNDCDTICNVCSAVRQVAGHVYTNACDTTCNKCGAVRTPSAHQYTDASDDTCNVCGAVRTPTLPSNPCSHTYSNACDATCNKCGYTRTISHSYGKYIYNNDATTSKDGTKTRTCTVCGDKQTVTATGTKLQSTKPQKSNPFTDVKKSDFFYTPVLWAVENGITSGTSATTFAPNEACTRGQIATFLWRAAGCPTPKTSKNPFTDVKKSDYYYKAVLWAVGKGITSGTSATTFSPNDPCTRGQIAAFLWRANGSKKVSTANPFKDVKKSDYYYNAVLWAVKSGITAGATKTTFEPGSPCTRGQIATFLYRAYN